MLLQDASWLTKHAEMDSAANVLHDILCLDPTNFEAQWLVQQISKIK